MYRSRTGSQRQTVKFLIAIAALAATCTGFAKQDSEAILDYAASINAYVDTTVGWTFQSTNALTVTELGCFAKVFDDNLAVSAILVGLWDHNASPLASNSITPGSIQIG